MTEEQKVRQQLYELVQKLQKFHWSPAHPSTYTITHPDNGKAVGIGIIAMRDPGAFNLVYSAVNGALATMSDQQRAVGLFVDYCEMVKQEVHTQSLSSWLTLLNQQEFKDWVQAEENNTDIPPYDLSRILHAIKLSKIHRV